MPSDPLPTSPRLDLGSERAVRGCPEAPGPCVRAGVALEWLEGNWSVSLEGEEAGSGSGFGSGHGAAELAEGRAMLSTIWETEGLQTVGIVVLVIASIKLLHLLGLISFSEGRKTEGGSEGGGKSTNFSFVLCRSWWKRSSWPDSCFINTPHFQ